MGRGREGGLLAWDDRIHPGSACQLRELSRARHGVAAPRPPLRREVADLLIVLRLVGHADGILCRLLVALTSSMPASFFAGDHTSWRRPLNTPANSANRAPALASFWSA